MISATGAAEAIEKNIETPTVNIKAGELYQKSITSEETIPKDKPQKIPKRVSLIKYFLKLAAPVFKSLAYIVWVWVPIASAR